MSATHDPRLTVGLIGLGNMGTALAERPRPWEALLVGAGLLLLGELAGASLDLATVVPSLAGPRRPQDRVALSNAKASFASALPDLEKGVNARGVIVYR